MTAPNATVLDLKDPEIHVKELEVGNFKTITKFSTEKANLDMVTTDGKKATF